MALGSRSGKWSTGLLGIKVDLAESDSRQYQSCVEGHGRRKIAVPY